MKASSRRIADPPALGTVTLLLALLLPLVAPAGLVEDWNAAVVEAIKADSPPPALAARNLAIVHLAMLRAAPSGPGANSAALTTTSSLFPSHLARFEAVYASHPPGTPSTRELGRTAAAGVLAERKNDNATTTVHYTPKTTPGQWRRTGPKRPPETPHWPRVTPFLLERADQFRPVPPPAPGSAELAAALHTVLELGGRDSTTRTPAQTTAARFWSDFSYTASPPGHWNAVAREITLTKHLPFEKSVELFAVLNAALADAAIAAFDCKYHYNYWRPVTAARHADPASTWNSLLESPPHPDYVSGHSTFSGAAATVLTHYFPEENLTFHARSDTLPDHVRTYSSFHDCAKEVSDSRVWGGIHFPFACDNGLAVGENVGKWCLDHTADLRSK